jgi:hypothetical protein
MTANNASQTVANHPSPAHVAYYEGRNSVWAGEKRACNPYSGDLADDWAAGRRHALAEERLDADTEWDE